MAKISNINAKINRTGIFLRTSCIVTSDVSAVSPLYQLSPSSQSAPGVDSLSTHVCLHVSAFSNYQTRLKGAILALKRLLAKDYYLLSGCTYVLPSSFIGEGFFIV